MAQQVYPVQFNQSYEAGPSPAGNYNYAANEVAALPAAQAIRLVALGLASFVNGSDATTFAAQVAGWLAANS